VLYPISQPSEMSTSESSSTDDDDNVYSSDEAEEQQEDTSYCSSEVNTGMFCCIVLCFV